MSKRIISIIIMVTLLNVAVSYAEIYRYQDADGKWHYTDITPAENKNAKTVDIEQTENQSRTNSKIKAKDLNTYLNERFQPNNEIEAATLSVVKITTPTGSGSGFFINEQGYIVTNKHVVRLTATKYWYSEQKKIESSQQKIKEIEDYLKQKKLEMQQYKKDLNDYKKRIVHAAEADKAKMQQTYDYYLKRYNQQKNQQSKVAANYKKSKAALAKYKRKISQSRATNTFTIILKDNTELQANLVKLSPSFDLALLKLTGNYKTPYLKNANDFTQGMDVYAIGSPLGFKDYVSKGIIMGEERGNIVTDTQILPGNSGGPLITTDGQVVGINTAVYQADKRIGTEVFGYAIPAPIAKKEFTNEVNGSIEQVN